MERDRQTALESLDKVHAAWLPSGRGNVAMALAQDSRQRRTRARAEGARAFPDNILGPATDDPQLDAGKLASGNQAIELRVFIEALHPVIRPVMGDKTERFLRFPLRAPDRMEDARVRAIQDASVRARAIKPTLRVMIAQPLGDEHRVVGALVVAGRQGIHLGGPLADIVVVDPV